MRAAAAALPEPRSATTSTGTSFCDNSRITASTVRMPALTLSSQTRAPPFCDATAVVRISVVSKSMLFRFLFRSQDTGETSRTKAYHKSRAHSLPIGQNRLQVAGISMWLCFSHLRLDTRHRDLMYTLAHCGQMGNLLPTS